MPSRLKNANVSIGRKSLHRSIPPNTDSGPALGLSCDFHDICAFVSSNEVLQHAILMHLIDYTRDRLDIEWLWKQRNSILVSINSQWY
jgi:hypothetical protein